MRLSHFLSVFAFISSANCQQEIQWNSHQLKTEFQKINAKLSFLFGEIDELKASGLNRGQQMDQLNELKQRDVAFQNEINTLKQQLSKPNQNVELENWKKEMNEKLSFVSDEVDELKASGLNRDQLMDQLNGFKATNDAFQNEINTLKQQLSTLNQKCELHNKFEQEMNSMKKEINDWRANMEQEVIHTKSQCKQREETLNDTIDSINEELLELKNNNRVLEKSVSLTKPYIYSRFFDQYDTKTPDFTWTIKDLKNKAKEENFILLSEVFPLKGYPFGAQAQLTNIGQNYLYIRIAFRDIHNGTDLDMKLIPSVHYTYKDGTSKDRIRYKSYVFNSYLEYDSFEYVGWLIRLIKIVSGEISIDIHVETPEVTQQGYSYDGQLTWAIHEYHKMKKMEEEEFIFYHISPHFYTSPKGYRVKCSLRLIGFDEYEGKGLIVYIDFLTGPYDAHLSKTFKHKTTFTLLHPTDPSKNIVKSKERDLIFSRGYTIGMGTHAEIEQLLDGDTLYYQIKITPA